MKNYPIIGEKNVNFQQGVSADSVGWESVYKEARSIEDDDLMQLYSHAYSNVRLIARAATKIEPKFVRRSNEDIEVDQHWLIEAFNSKKRRTSMRELMESIYCYSLISDHTFLQLHYSQKSRLRLPYAIDVVLPTSVSFDYDKKDKTFKGFLLNTSQGKTRSLDEKEIIHIADFCPLNKLGGYSPVKALKGYLTIEQMITLYQVGFFQNSAIPSGAFVIEADKADFDNIVDQIKRKHMGAGNNHAIQFIRKSPRKDQAMSFEKYQTDNNSLEMGELFNRIDKKIDEAFGIPKEMKGDITATNLAGVKMAERIFLKQVVIPKVETVFDRINSFLCRCFPNEDIMLTFDNPLPDDTEGAIEQAEHKKLCAETARILKQAGATDETVRLVTGIEELQFIEAPVVDTGIRNTDVTEFVETSTKNADIAEVDTEDKNKTINSEEQNETVNAGEKLLSFEQLQKEENAILIPFEEHLANQLKRALKLLNKKTIDDVDNLDVEEEVADMVKLVLPAFFVLLEKSGRQHRAQALRELGIPSASVTSPLLTNNFRNAITARLSGVFRRFTQETVIDIKTLQSTAEQLGWSRATFRKELIKYYESQGEFIQEGGKVVKNNVRYRADRLIDTEANRANNRASLEQMQIIQRDTGINFTKIWRRRNTHPEPICDALDGREVGLSTPFLKEGEIITEVNGKAVTHNYFEVDVPPEHPHCQCYLEYKRIGG